MDFGEISALGQRLTTLDNIYIQNDRQTDNKPRIVEASFTC
jgi:hypothetical protein